MLAGRMKLKNFVTLAGLLGLGGMGALWFMGQGEDEPEEPAVETPDKPDRPERVQGNKPVFEGEDDPEADKPWTDVPLSAVDARVVAELAREMASDKGKDVWGGGSAEKLNVYDDDGDHVADRAKLDWDRDDKPDQKFEQAEGRVRMFWSPEDDEDYSQEFELDEASGRWTRRSGEVLYVTHGQGPAPVEAEPEALPEPEQAPPLDELTVAILAWQGKQASGGKLKDVSQGRPYKINVYQDEGEASINRAKIDLDRDDKWDIKVTYAEAITRKVSPGDDEDYVLEEVFQDGTWLPI